MPNHLPTVVNVAVAVIHYQQQYLLGFRHAAQHQGNRYEFVGGKIDADESPIAALIREVAEETGMDISGISGISGISESSAGAASQNHATTAIKLGRLHHDYGDKQVCLQVYKVALTAAQYQEYQHYEQGLEGQALKWVSKDTLLAGVYPLPAANRTILSWLSLPSQVAITYPIAHFYQQTDIEPASLDKTNVEQDNSIAQAAWLTYHQQHLPAAAWVYIRPKADDSAAIAAQLMQARPDIQTLLPMSLLSTQSLPNVQALHLTHAEVMRWFNRHKTQAQHTTNHDHVGLSATYPLIISCHDRDSIHAANQLAALRVQQQLPPVIAIFLSPVMSTQSHPDTDALGWEKWSSLAQLADMPVIALGGLAPAMRSTATQYGAMSIAGIRQFHEG